MSLHRYVELMFTVQNDVMFLSLELHYSIALLLMNAYATHISAKQIQHLFIDGHTQASAAPCILIISISLFS